MHSEEETLLMSVYRPWSQLLQVHCHSCLHSDQMFAWRAEWMMCSPAAPPRQLKGAYILVMLSVCFRANLPKWQSLIKKSTQSCTLNSANSWYFQIARWAAAVLCGLTPVSAVRNFRRWPVMKGTVTATDWLTCVGGTLNYQSIRQTNWTNWLLICHCCK